ncbi:MAG TPA: secretin N-terminal domain-containing protein, partial [Verrucomicrobiota bacterium]|nr:secretin N-terminal domain-containing protein [Verrucomicrobiota bacterium]
TGGYYNQGGYNQPYVPMATGGGTAATASAAAGDSFQNRLRRIIERASDQGELQILGETKILADERSNSLLVFATRQDMEMIKTIIAKLDIVLPQVLIETIIMDVQLDDSWLFGVSAGQHRQGEAGSAEVGGASNNENNLLGNLADFFSGGGTNTFPTSAGLTYFGRFNGDFDLAVQAAATDSRINVIQKPRILTSHATPGRIFVGSTVPYVTGTYYGGGFGGPSSSYQQLRVGIGLEVVPFINPDGLVVMEIYETIEEVSGSTAITGVGNVPNTTTREFAANVAVRDGDSVMLGGFIRNSTNKDVSGVPILKDIPLLGALFSSRSSSKSRKELIVLMRPTVLKTPEIAALASAAEKDRLPGVTRADAEVQEFERKEFDRQQEEIRSRQQQEQRKRR